MEDKNSLKYHNNSPGLPEVLKNVGNVAVYAEMLLPTTTLVLYNPLFSTEEEGPGITHIS